MKKLIFALGLCLSMSVSGQNWQLEWSDEFSGTSLDLTKWSYETGTGVNGDFGTGQLDRATDRPENVAIEQGITGADGGALRITTRKEFYIDRNYTSGRINTSGKYGWGPNHRLVARVWPKGVHNMGQGFAFWLMPNEKPVDQPTISWPQGGEVDIMEYVGSIPAHNLGTVHYAWDYNNNEYADWNHGSHGAYYSFADQQVPDSPEWLQVDLGSNQSIGRVNINWENSGRTYQIQVSTNGTAWTNVYTTTVVTPGVKDITFGTQTARYVRMYGSQRNNAWGYSIYEFQVFAANSTTNLALNKTATASSVQGTDVAANFAVDGDVVTRWSSGLRNPQYQCCVPSSTTDPNIGANAWHTYGVNWYEDRIEFFIDDNVYHIHYFVDGQGLDNPFAADGENQDDIYLVGGKRVMKSEYSNLFNQWHPFEHEMYIILSAGVGGGGNTYGGPIVDQAIFPTDVYIDWVRVYNNGITYNPPPTAVLTAPTGTETYWAPASVTLSAIAADTKGGTISSVAFYDGTALIGTDNTAPYSYSLTGLSAGVHNIKAVATDNGGKTGASGIISIAVNDANSNLALNRPGAASSVKGANGANLAFDNNITTRWESLDATDPSWVYVDLGNSYNINRVKITWETSSAKDYQIQVADNINGPWTTIKSVTGNAVLVNDLTGLSGSGRYVRMYGTARTTTYAYSIFQMEVYGTGGNLPPVVALTSPTSGTTLTPPATINIAANASDPDGSIAQVEFFNGSTSLNVDNTSPYAYTWSNVAAGTYTITAVATDNKGSKTTSTSVVVVVSSSSNLALNKTGTALSVAGGNLANYAFDGDIGSRWESASSDPQWIYVDLGASYSIGEVKITWETAAGKDYLVQVSDNTTTWNTIKTVTGNTTLVNDHTGLSGSGRYVRIYGTARTTGWGYSIFQMEVYKGGAITPVTGVTLNATTASIVVGATTQLTATVAPANATNKNVTWTSSNNAIATVSASGLVTGVAAGSATITVTTQDGNKSATCAVTVSIVNVPVTSVTLNATTASIAIGATTQLTATVAPSNATNKNVSWTSSNNAVATVSSTGLVTGVAAGSSNITVTTQDGNKTAVCAVTVTPASTNLALNKTGTASSVAGGNLANYAFDGDIGSRWESASSDPQWIYVDLGATYNINRVKITWETASGKDFLVQVSDNTTTWNTTMKTVTGNTALVNDYTGLTGSGRYVRIYGTARTTGWGYSIFQMEVYGTPGTTIPVTGVTLNATTASIVVGATTQLTATVAPANATNKNVTWTSSNNAIATVSASGLVTGVAVGTTNITVTTQDGNKTATCAVTVTNNPTTNVALNKPATSSSNEAGYTASGCNDGNSVTRWASAFSDPQWVMIDLGASYSISRVVLNWEAAAGKSYQIQVSADGVNNWTPIYTTTTGAAGIASLTVSGTGRYIRIYGTVRTTGYGYSLYEFEVYGTLSTSSAKVETEVAEVSQDKVNAYPNPVTSILNVNFGENHNYNKLILVDITGKVVLNKSIESGSNAASYDLSSLENGMYFLRLSGNSEPSVISIMKK